jgi:hypothetical protein
MPIHFTCIIDWSDCRMMQARCRLSFTQEATACFVRLSKGSRQKFERNAAFHCGVVRFPDGSHTAFAQLLNDAVPPNGMPDHRGFPALTPDKPSWL